jgi:hypothetical protein
VITRGVNRWVNYRTGRPSKYGRPIRERTPERGSRRDLRKQRIANDIAVHPLFTNNVPT